MSKKVIPLRNSEEYANYQEYITLGDYSYLFSFHYLQNGQWRFDVIADGDVGDVPTTTLNDTDYVFLGLMLEGGVDIVSMYQVSDTFGQLFFVGDEVTLNNAGDSNYLVWVSPDDLVS
jgi:hypothetical protein